MNCQQFDRVVGDVARGQWRGDQRGASPAVLMDAQTRDDALAHAEICARCGARLGAEKALNAGLGALAAGEESLAAPARVEAALLAAFRQSVAAQAFPVTQTTPVPAATPASILMTRRGQWLRWAAAAAAVITLAALGLLQLSGAKQQPDIVERKSVPMPTPEPSPTPRLLGTPQMPDEDAPEAVRQANIRPAPRGARRSQERRGRSPWDEARLTVNLGAVEVASPREEVATDFIPVNYSGAQPPLDGGQVVRVKMPRAALASFGLPVNAERSHEPIKADVLYGADGLARAVRFVRD
jgi:hypothetical protein